MTHCEREVWGFIGIGGLVMQGKETPVWRLSKRILYSLYYHDPDRNLVPVCEGKGEDKDAILKRIQLLQESGLAIDVMLSPSRRRRDMKRLRDRRWRDAHRARKATDLNEEFLEQLQLVE